MHFKKSLETKFASGTKGQLRGIASTFGGEPDSYGDVIMAGAFTKSLRDWQARGQNIPLLWSHDAHDPVGVIEDAQQTAAGLEITAQLIEGTESADKALKLLKLGALSMSIGFWAPQDKVKIGKGGIREIHEVDLAEISLVTVPANRHAAVHAVKSDIRMFEFLVRDALGLSAREAKRLSASGYAAMVRDEPPGPSDVAVKAALSRIINARNP